MRATTPPPAPIPERVPQASSRVRTITDPCWAWLPLAQKMNLDAFGLVPLQRGQSPPPPVSRNVYPHQAMHGVHQCGSQGEDFVRPRHRTKMAQCERHQRTQPPGRHDEARSGPTNNVSHEMGPPTLFGLPMATCDHSTSFSARLISGYDVGNSICNLTRWECNTGYSSPAIVPT